MQVKVRWSAREVVQDFPEGTAMDVAIANPSIKAYLGYGDNVVPCIGPIPQPKGTPIYVTVRTPEFTGCVLNVQEKECTKEVKGS